MINPILQPLIRRAILDLMDKIGGEQNDDVLAKLLASAGHFVSRRDIAVELGWLDVNGLVRSERLGPYTVAEILPDGIDAAAGRLQVDGVDRHKSGR